MLHNLCSGRGSIQNLSVIWFSFYALLCFTRAIKRCSVQKLLLLQNTLLTLLEQIVNIPYNGQKCHPTKTVIESTSKQKEHHQARTTHDATKEKREEVWCWRYNRERKGQTEIIGAWILNIFYSDWSQDLKNFKNELSMTVPRRCVLFPGDARASLCDIRSVCWIRWTIVVQILRTKLKKTQQTGRRIFNVLLCDVFIFSWIGLFFEMNE